MYSLPFSSRPGGEALWYGGKLVVSKCPRTKMMARIQKVKTKTRTSGEARRSENHLRSFPRVFWGWREQGHFTIRDSPKGCFLFGHPKVQRSYFTLPVILVFKPWFSLYHRFGTFSYFEKILLGRSISTNLLQIPLALPYRKKLMGFVISMHENEKFL